MGKNVIISTLPNISQNYLSKLSTGNIFVDSLVYDNGTSVMINTATAHADYASARLIVNNTGNAYLEVRGNGGQGSIILSTSTSTTSTYPTIEIFNSGNFGIIGYRPGVVSSNYLMYYDLGSSTNRALTFQTEGVTRLGIQQSGRILMGPTLPTDDGSTALQVNGGGKFSSSVTAKTSINLVHSNNTTIAKIEEFSGTQGAGLSLFNSTGTQNVLFNAGGDSFIRGGNVGIGLTDPSRKFQVMEAGTSTSGNVMAIRNDNTTSGAFINFIAGGGNAPAIGAKGNDIVFTADGYSGTERMRITSGGNLNFNPNGTVSYINVNIGTGNDGGILMRRADSAKFQIGLTTPGDALFFYNYATSNESMRITSGGFTKASNDATYAGISASYHEFRSNQNTRVVAFSNKSATLTEDNGILIQFASASPNNTTARFIVAEDTTATRFVVYSNGNVQNQNNSYGQLSDVKLKENISDATAKLADLMKVKVKNFNFIGDSQKQIGVIAQELEEVFPMMVEDIEDKVRDAETNETISLGTTTKSVKYSVFVPMLIKAIQELKAQIEEQKADIESLKTLINK